MTDHDTDNPYQPVPCAIHSEYELAIMQHRHLQLIWKDPHGMQHIGHLQPVDLKIRNQAEFLLAKDHEGQLLQIRLDYIQQYRILY